MRSPTVFACVMLSLAGAAFAAPEADLEPARGLALQGKTDEALAAAKAAVATAPDDAAPGRLVQDLLRAEGRAEELSTWVPTGVAAPVRLLLDARILPPAPAEAALKELLTKPGAPPQTHVDLAYAYLALDKTRSAETEAKAYVELRPDDAEGHYALALVRLTSGKALAAQEPAGTAVMLAPGWAPAVVLFSDVASELGKPGEGRKALQDALARYPQNPALVRGLARDQIRAGELAEAVTTFGKLIGLRPEDASARVQLADVQMQLGKLAEAEATVRAAIELAPKDASAQRMLGLLLEKKDDFEGALAAYDAAAELKPDWPQIYVDQGIVLTLLQDYQPAREALEYAVKLDKDLLEAHFRLAKVLYLQDDLKAAKKSVGVVLSADGDHVGANRLMGRIYLAEGKGKNAIKHFQKAADLDRKDADSMRMIGKALMQLGKPEEAREAISKALDRDEKDPWSNMEYGKVLEALEDFEGAEEYYKKAIELAPAMSWPHFYLAQLLDDVNDDAEGALAEYKRFLELGGADPDGDVKARIEQLDK